jgi:hypothetical protein
MREKSKIVLILAIVAVLVIVGFGSGYILPQDIGTQMITAEEMLKPINDIDIQWTMVGGTLAYTCVDDLPLSPDNDVTYVQRIANDKWDPCIFKMSSASSSIVSAKKDILKISIVARMTGVHSRVTPILKQGTAINTEFKEEIPTTAWTTYRWDLTTNPFTKAAWTWDTLSATNIGMNAFTTSGYDVAYAKLTQFYVIVTYVQQYQFTDIVPDAQIYLIPNGGNSYAALDDSPLLGNDGSATSISNTATSSCNWAGTTLDMSNHADEIGTITSIQVKMVVYCNKIYGYPPSDYNPFAQMTLYTHDTSKIYGPYRWNAGAWTTVQTNEIIYNPQTNEPWTWDEIDNLKIGAETKPGALGHQSNPKQTTSITQVFVIVNYKTATQTITPAPPAQGPITTTPPSQPSAPTVVGVELGLFTMILALVLIIMLFIYHRKK